MATHDHSAELHTLCICETMDLTLIAQPLAACSLGTYKIEPAPVIAPPLCKGYYCIFDGKGWLG
jgi:hypothetical protein